MGPPGRWATVDSFAVTAVSVGREAEGARDGVRIAALLCIVGTCVSQAVDVQDFVSFRGVKERKEREKMGEQRERTAAF